MNHAIATRGKRMQESFSVVDKYKKGKRFYLNISCQEGHVSNVRWDVYETKKYCNECQKKYRRTAAYWILDGAKQRCYNPKNSKYEYYGNKGITVCDKWLAISYFGVRNFLEDMGERPEGTSIDRIDVNGNYCKENCRWASPSVQGYNQTKRSTNTSGVTGVYWNSRREQWEAKITVKNEDKYLGSGVDFNEVVKIRKEAELKYFGVNKG